MKKLFSLVALLSCTIWLFACDGGDNTAPIVTSFTMPATASVLTVLVTSLTATDDVGVTGYLITTSSTAPSATDAGWTTNAPTSFTFSAAGTQTAFAWAKDLAGHVSASRSATVTITTVPAAAVQGIVINPETGLPLAGATVDAHQQISGVAKTVNATAVATAITNSDGSYSVTGLEVGTTYYLEFALQGFAPLVHYNVVPSADILTLETVRPIPVAWQSQGAAVSGKVKNASTNAGLPNMTVKIRPGVANRLGSTVTASTITDATGAYSFANLGPGTYTAEITGNIGSNPIITSYSTLNSFLGNASANSNQDFPVTAPLSSTGSGQYRIVLTWGNSPSDLDSHLTGPTPTSGARFHIAYYDVDYPLGSTTFHSSGFQVAGPSTEAFIDVDNTMHGFDNGPETTTIVTARTGTYNFYVHHFAGSGNISASGAQVNVYKGSSLLATFNPVAGAAGVDDVWSVFSMTVTGDGVIITPVNTITPNLDTDTL